MSKAAKTTKILRCPTCKTIVLSSDADFPFCSDRCRQIDLGKWASGVYKVSSPILDPEVLEGIDDELLRPGGNDDED